MITKTFCQTFEVYENQKFSVSEFPINAVSGSLVDYSNMLISQRINDSGLEVHFAF